MPRYRGDGGSVWFGRSVSLPFVVSAVEPLVGVFDERGVTTSLDPLFPSSTVPDEGSFFGSGTPDWFRSDLDPPLDSFKSGYLVSLRPPEVCDKARPLIIHVARNSEDISVLLPYRDDVTLSVADLERQPISLFPEMLWKILCDSALYRRKVFSDRFNPLG